VGRSRGARRLPSAMQRDSLRRVRGGNVGRAVAAVGAVVSVVAWPRLAPAPPRLPPDRATPLVAAVPTAGPSGPAGRNRRPAQADGPAGARTAQADGPAGAGTARAAVASRRRARRRPSRATADATRAGERGRRPSRRRRAAKARRAPAGRAKPAGPGPPTGPPPAGPPSAGPPSAPPPDPLRSPASPPVAHRAAPAPVRPHATPPPPTEFDFER
jgi:hypothetical protein